MVENLKVSWSCRPRRCSNYVMDFERDLLEVLVFYMIYLVEHLVCTQAVNKHIAAFFIFGGVKV